MSVRERGKIDGIGLERDGLTVVLLISDDLLWDDPSHTDALAAKLESYASAVLSGTLAEHYPPARGKRTTIRLIWQHKPTGEARRFLDAAQDQLDRVGIGFTDMPLPSD